MRVSIEKRAECYSGKAKTLYFTDQPEYLITEFRDDATAFNGVKHALFAGKGAFNNQFNAHIMQKLTEAGISHHFVGLYSKTESIVKKMTMIPVECVVRNYAAGGMCKRFGIEEGAPLSPSVFEFFLKSDEQNDPMVNSSHIRTFNWATEQEMKTMREQTLQVNEILTDFFAQAGLLLVDFKLEFGRCDGQVILGDEITPDGCRIWDRDTHARFDKDVFRRDLGDLMDTYRALADRLGMHDLALVAG